MSRWELRSTYRLHVVPQGGVSFDQTSHREKQVNSPSVEEEAEGVAKGCGDPLLIEQLHTGRFCFVASRVVTKLLQLLVSRQASQRVFADVPGVVSEKHTR